MQEQQQLFSLLHQIIIKTITQEIEPFQKQLNQIVNVSKSIELHNKEIKKEIDNIKTMNDNRIQELNNQINQLQQQIKQLEEMNQNKNKIDEVKKDSISTEQLKSIKSIKTKIKNDFDEMKLSFEREVKRIEDNQNELYESIELKLSLIEDKLNIQSQQTSSVSSLIEKEQYNLTSKEKKQIEEWCELKCGEIIFDSDVENWPTNSSILNDKIIGKKQLVFIIEDDENEKFGYYLNTEIVEEFDEFGYYEKT